MEQLLAVYKRPYSPDHAVICLGETTKQLVSEVSQPILTSEGMALYDYEYHQKGVCDSYMISKPLAG